MPKWAKVTLAIVGCLALGVAAGVGACYGAWVLGFSSTVCYLLDMVVAFAVTFVSSQLIVAPILFG